MINSLTETTNQIDWDNHSIRDIINILGKDWDKNNKFANGYVFIQKVADPTIFIGKGLSFNDVQSAFNAIRLKLVGKAMQSPDGLIADEEIEGLSDALDCFFFGIEFEESGKVSINWNDLTVQQIVEELVGDTDSMTIHQARENSHAFLILIKDIYDGHLGELTRTDIVVGLRALRNKEEGHLTNLFKALNTFFIGFDEFRKKTD